MSASSRRALDVEMREERMREMAGEMYRLIQAIPLAGQGLAINSRMRLAAIREQAESIIKRVEAP